jgi:two-component system sensor histidine kinase/response regulator
VKLLEDKTVSITPSILLVDDNPLILGVVKSLLQTEKMEVYACESGQEAMKILGSQPVDLVICDVMMPELSGYQFQQMVRERVEFANIPFVFLTALDSPDDKIKGKASGADDYLTKPFDPKELLAMVKGKVERAREKKQQIESRYDQYRRKVLHTLSHEFRTPLVAISTGTEILLDQPELEEKKLKTLVEAIQRGGLRLERLVNDFMILQQIEAGLAKRLAETKKTIVSVEDIAERIVGQIKDAVLNEGAELIVEKTLLPQKLEVFEAQILDCVSRIVQNGCKFSKHPKKIQIHFLTQGDEFVIQVLDNGIGFKENQLEHMTLAFNQVDRDKLEQQGSGAGLAIACSYAEFNGARITFQNRPEGGAKVTLILPTVGSF